MLNKSEKIAVVSMVARWEFMQGGSTAEAGAFGRAAREVIDLFKFSDDDLEFDRQYECFKTLQKSGMPDNDHCFDNLIDTWAEIGMREFINRMDDAPKQLIADIAQRQPKWTK